MDDLGRPDVVEGEQYSTPAKMVQDRYNVTLTVGTVAFRSFLLERGDFCPKFADIPKKST